MFRRTKGPHNTPGGRLLDWTSIWTLQGDFLICNECHATQTIRQAETLFTHHGGCSNAKNGVNPWEELRDILACLSVGHTR